MKDSILALLERAGRPLTFNDILEATGERQPTQRALEELELACRIVQTRKQRYALPAQAGLVHGRIQGSAPGFGFLTPDSGGEELFIPADGMHGAMHGDEVYVRQTALAGRFGKGEAEVYAVTRRALGAVVGTLHGGCVCPDERRLPFDLPLVRGSLTAREGDKVVAEIVQYPDGRRPCLGRIIEVLGRVGAPGVDVLSVIRRLGIRETFPEGVRRLAEATPAAVPENETAGREDWRGALIVTIDGADSKDYDDAVSCEPLDNGRILLGVHIADVSAYVPARGALDREALERGTSVYVADRVLPMLPEQLSCGICSLNPGVDRLALSCLMELDIKGRVCAHRIAETVIRSRARLTYDDVNAFFAGDAVQTERLAAYGPLLDGLDALQKLLTGRRTARGALDFDVPEPRFTFDEAGRAVDLVRRARGPAERLIEACMICANETVAEHMRALDAPFLYRVHERPDVDKLAALQAFLKTQGIAVRGGAQANPRALQRALAEAKDTPSAGLIARLALRAMQKARYSPENVGHFGLASECYCHFTSPIRRYPDLMCHRVIKLSLRGELTEQRIQRLREYLPGVAEAANAAERAAMEAERAVDALKACEYMATQIGCSYDGVVSGVANTALFVELPNTAEGTVRLQTLDDDFYLYDPEDWCVTGRTYGRVIRLGDSVRVRVSNVDLTRVCIDLTLENGYDTFHIHQAPSGKTAGKGARHGRQGRKAFGAKPKGKA